MPANTVFATGVLVDNKDGLFMTGSGKELRWVAIRGGADDFCIYCHFADKTTEWIERYGDKVYNERNIRRCVEMDDDAFKRYRY